MTHILVVEDEANVRHTVAQMLRLSGFVVEEAATGHDAVVCAGSARLDLVLSDIRLPGMNGFETFRAIRALQPEVRGLAMTGYADRWSGECARSAGFHSLLCKPFTFEVLLDAVQAALSR